MSSLGRGYKMHLKVVWNRVGVANFQRQFWFFFTDTLSLDRNNTLQIFLG